MIVRLSLTALLLMLIPYPHDAAADDVKPATLRVDDKPFWVGQRVPLSIELRAAGSFSGTASFALPQIPKVVIIKVGNPVVSSEEKGDQTWFVQTHEFALFSQADGIVEIPAFDVQFSHHEGFTGPVKDVTAHLDATRINIKRPDGSKDNAFLVTAKSIEITESWEPKPGTAKLGDVVHRTITQHADQVTGMALAPLPQADLEGVRTYPARPVVTDATERGDLSGTRKDDITYVIQKPGQWTIPAVTYMWWDPDKQQFGSKTLPAVTFDVPAPPAPVPAQVSSGTRRGVWLLAIGTLFVLLGFAIWQQHQLAAWCQTVWHRWNPPDRVAARKLIRHCRRNDPAAANAAWIEWQNTQSPEFVLEVALRSAALELQRSLYAVPPNSVWNGQTFAVAFRAQCNRQQQVSKPQRSSLPELNPSTSISS